MSLRLTAYRGVTRLASPFMPLYLRRRAGAGKEISSRLPERYGRSETARPDGKLIWLHGASVGEVTLMLPLIEALSTGANILLTSGTVTSAQLAAARLPAGALHQFAPIDTPASVARFLSHWQPDLAVWAESEIWPNLVSQTARAGIPMALINARLSEASLAGWARRAASARELFGAFDVILPADARTAQGLGDILGTPLELAGNLKFDAPPLTFDADTAAQLKAALGARPIWLAASTHPSEDAQILAAHRQLQARYPDAALIWAPRHPERGAAIKALCGRANLAQRSAGQRPNAQTDIYLFDTLGEMGLAYTLADLAVICGSLCPELMGHNPLEPARLGTPILTGPYVASFSEIYERFFQNGAALRIAPERLGMSLGEQFFDGLSRAALAKNASEIAAQSSGVLDETLRQLRALL